MQDTTEIPRDAWNKFFTRFSQDHETQFVAVEVMGRDIGAQLEGKSLLLSGISPADDAGESLALSFDSVNGEHLTHMVNKPTHVWVQRAPDHTDEALEIESADGTRTLVRFPPYEPGSRSEDLKGVERFRAKGTMMNKNFSFLSGFALGAAFMYAFDPTGGRRRRALVRDKFTRAAHIAGDGIDAASRDWSNRAAGTVAEARRRLRRDQPEDEILVERVRAALGRSVSHPKAIDVDARQGTVRLCGPILSHEVNGLLRAVESVPGVTNIDNQLEPHEQAGNIPALQGGNDTMPVPQW